MRKLLKAQIWYFDLIIALTIFTLIVILSFKYITETFVFQSSDILEDAKKFSDSLMSEGIPSNWNSSTVKSIGLLSNNTLDAAKLSAFVNLTADDYYNVKSISSSKFDFLVVFENEEIPGTDVIGYPGYDYNLVKSLETEELVELSRYLAYRHDGIAEVILMKIVMWDAS